MILLIYIYIYIYRSLGVVSDKIASAKRNPGILVLLLLLLLIIIMGDARVRVKENLESWALF